MTVIVPSSLGQPSAARREDGRVTVPSDPRRFAALLDAQTDVARSDGRPARFGAFGMFGRGMRPIAHDRAAIPSANEPMARAEDHKATQRTESRPEPTASSPRTRETVPVRAIGAANPQTPGRRDPGLPSAPSAPAPIASQVLADRASDAAEPIQIVRVAARIPRSAPRIAPNLVLFGGGSEVQIIARAAIPAVDAPELRHRLALVAAEYGIVPARVRLNGGDRPAPSIAGGSHGDRTR